jgi:DNA-binding transcriptional LysR family regulator
MLSGEVDFAFALATSQMPPGALSQLVMRDRLALVVRKGHRWGRRRWSLADYAAAGHASVSLIGDGQSDIDRELAAAGLARRIALVTPHFVAALAAVGESDLVTTVSRRLAERFADVFGLALLEPPLANTALDVTLVWSQLRSGDPVLDWVRGVIAEAGASL